MMDYRKAAFPGSFDPFTLGHLDIVNRSLQLFDRVYIAIGHNSAKKTLFPLEQREAWIGELFANEGRVEVANYEGLTADFCLRNDIGCIVRGLRSGIDFEYERTIAQLNHEIGDGLETLFLASKPANSHISSTIVREILSHKGNAKAYLPEVVLKRVHEFLGA